MMNGANTRTCSPVALIFLGLSLACHDARGVEEAPPPAERTGGEVAQEVQHGAVEPDEPEEGAQQRLRAFKTSARASLVSLDAKLKRLEGRVTAPHAVGSASRAPTQQAFATFTTQRHVLSRRIDALEVDARSKWEHTKSDLEAQLAELHRNLDRALDGGGSESQRSAY